MAECECLPTCLFFNDHMIGLDAIKEMMKRRYCLGDNTDCARYMVFSTLGKGQVPTDLIPNQPGKARAVIAAAKSDRKM